MKIIFKLLFSLTLSNASVESLFSDLNLCKTNHRNKLLTKSLVANLHTKRGIEKEGGL